MKEEVFEQRIREYTPNMYRLAYGILQNHEDAQDAVGETILRAFEKYIRCAVPNVSGRG